MTSLISQRYVNSHLVTIEVSVESATNHWVQADSLSFNQYWLESLNRETVKGRCTVQQYVVVSDNLIENLVSLFCFSIHHSASRTHVMSVFLFNQFVDDKWLEQFKGHFLWQTTLVQFEIWSNDDNRTSRVVNTLSKQVLTETSLLSFQGICQRTERSTLTSRSCCRSLSTTSTVVKESINCFLKHTLFIACNNLRSTNSHQFLETIVTVDDTTIEIVQIRSSETATIQSDHRTKVRWNNRKSCWQHPFKTQSGLFKSLIHFETLEEFLGIHSFVGSKLCFQNFQLLLYINLFQNLANSFSTDTGSKDLSETTGEIEVIYFRKNLVWANILDIIFRSLVLIFQFIQDFLKNLFVLLSSFHFFLLCFVLLFQGNHRLLFQILVYIHDDIGREIDNTLKFLRRDSQNQTDF